MAFDPNTYDYQGDENNLEIKVGANARVKENLTGNEAFAYIQSSHKVVTLEEGTNIFITFPDRLLMEPIPQTG